METGEARKVGSRQVLNDTLRCPTEINRHTHMQISTHGLPLLVRLDYFYLGLGKSWHYYLLKPLKKLRLREGKSLTH